MELESYRFPNRPKNNAPPTEMVAAARGAIDDLILWNGADSAAYDVIGELMEALGNDTAAYARILMHLKDHKPT